MTRDEKIRLLKALRDGKISLSNFVERLDASSFNYDHLTLAELELFSYYLDRDFQKWPSTLKKFLEDLERERELRDRVEMVCGGNIVTGDPERPGTCIVRYKDLTRRPLVHSNDPYIAFKNNTELLELLPKRVQIHSPLEEGSIKNW